MLLLRGVEAPAWLAVSLLGLWMMTCAASRELWGYKQFPVRVSISSANGCLLESLTIPTLNVPSSFYCLLKCHLMNVCTSAAVDEDSNECLLYKFPMVPYNDDTMSSLRPIFMLATLQSPDVTDLAYGIPVTAGSNWPQYTKPEQLTNGNLCQTTFHDCFSTNWTKKWIKVDLGAPALVKRIVVRASFGRDRPYLMSSWVRVGDAGHSEYDPVFGSITRQPTHDFEMMTLTHPGLTGRYITVESPQTVDKALCFCNLFVYAE